MNIFILKPNNYPNCYNLYALQITPMEIVISILYPGQLYGSGIKKTLYFENELLQLATILKP